MDEGGGRLVVASRSLLLPDKPGRDGPDSRHDDVRGRSDDPPPHGESLPGGAFEVTIRPVVAESVVENPDETVMGIDRILGLIAENERNAPALPGDMAENLDHYSHGKPLP